MSVHNQDLQHDTPPGGGTGGGSGERPLQLEDLVYINRMCTVGHVLPAVAHELNNALQVIGGLVELLGMKGDLPADVRDKVLKIGLQSNRSAGMMREFVAYARRDDTSARIDMQKAVEHALTMRRYHLSRARIEVVVDAPAEPLTIRADSHAALQVLLNLIINAEEALQQVPQGQRELRVTVTSDADTVACTIRDNGPGFTGDAKAHAPKPFYSTKTQGAAGLGLTVAQALVALDKGVLRVAEGPGGGVEVRWLKA
jgi:two-component system, NtrC family, C4-dicarboxylate transport sensor histidine kinase DctB